MAKINEYELGAYMAISVWFNDFHGPQLTIRASDNRRPPEKPDPNHTVIEITANYGKPYVALHLTDSQLVTLYDVIGRRLDWIATRCPECLMAAAAETNVLCEPCQAKLAEEQHKYEQRVAGAQP